MLGNFPLSNRLQTLLCAKNRISTISENMSKSVPNLHTLVLTENHINELADLDSLQGFTKLTYLSLKENPVAEKEVRATEADMEGAIADYVAELQILGTLAVSFSPLS